MEVRELRTFLCVAQLKSFTRAASQLHIAQPALSRQIQKLEEELDLTLFDRHARGVRLTEAGVVLQRKAELIVRDLSGLRNDLREAAGVGRGHLTIAVPPVAGSILFPPFLAAIRERLPNVSVRLLEGVSSALQSWILDETVDFAILHNAPPLPDLHSHPLVREQMVVVGPVGGVLADRPCRLHDLQGLPLILPAHPHFNRLLIEQAAVQYNLRLTIALEVDGIGMTRELVARGFGYGFMTRAAAALHREAASLKVARLMAPQLWSELSVVHRRAAERTSIHADALAIMEQVANALIAAGEWIGAEAMRRS
jgi:LysR family nitrogen assimilation transcriptional regulator